MVILLLNKELIKWSLLFLFSLFKYMYAALKLMLHLWQYACISIKNNEDYEE